MTPLTTRCCECGHKGDSPRDFAWYDHLGGYLCLNKSSCIARRCFARKETTS